MLLRPRQTRSSRPRLLLWLLLGLLAPAHLHAQAIDRGREADVLRLLLPYVDEGPVGDAKLSRIAIRADGIDLDVIDPLGQIGSLHLTPRAHDDAAPGSKSFRIETPTAPTAALNAAQQRLKAAILTNDDGTFFGHSPVVPARAAQREPALSADALALALHLADALWVALVLLLLWHMLRERAPAKWLFWLTFSLFATLMRRRLAFAPLHANGHAFEDMLMLLGGPDAQGATARFVAQYGPAWLSPQRALLRLFGETHDQLAATSSALGGLAAAFATAAAWRVSRQWLWTALAAAVVVFAPAAARVGHSESTFVVAQLLVAIALWLSTHSGALPRLAFGLTLALLVLGHPIGIGLAVGVYLLVLALTLDGAPLALRRELPLVLVLVTAIALELSLSRAGVSDRLTYASQFHVPVPTLPNHYWLWLQSGFAPRVACLAGLAGIWSIGIAHSGARRWWTLAAAVAGTGLVLVAGLLVTACVTDGVRYQAPFAPVLTLLLARVGQGLSGPLQGRLLSLFLWFGVAYGLTDLRAGKRLDAQGQAYQSLRHAVAGLHGDVWLVAPDRGDGHERVVVELPSGRLSASGANLRHLTAHDVRNACTAHRPLPPQAFVWLGEACSAQVPAGAPLPCATLEPLAGETVQQFQVLPQPRIASDGMAGEFNNYPDGNILLRLAPLKCP